MHSSLETFEFGTNQGTELRWVGIVSVVEILKDFQRQASEFTMRSAHFTRVRILIQLNTVKREKRAPCNDKTMNGGAEESSQRKWEGAQCGIIFLARKEKCALFSTYYEKHRCD